MARVAFRAFEKKLYGASPKLGVPFFRGVPIMRIIAYWGLDLGPPMYGNSRTEAQGEKKHFRGQSSLNPELSSVLDIFRGLRVC